MNYYKPRYVKNAPCYGYMGRGYNMGVRLIEDFLARSGPLIGKCADFRETAEAISKVCLVA